MTKKDYLKLSKKELLQVMADVSEKLKNGIQEYCTPDGDAWTIKDEINKYSHNSILDVKVLVKLVDKDENGLAIDNGVLNYNKQCMVDCVLVLDLAYIGMNNIYFKHPLYNHTKRLGLI